MQRREFITFLSAAAVWPLSAHAQQRGRVPRVGVLWHAGSAEEEGPYLSALQQALNGLGYIDGRTITLEHRFPNEEPDQFVSLAAGLAADRVDVLVASSTLSALAAQRATAVIPVVFVVVPDPVGIKLVDSLARPGGNITGLTNVSSDLSAKRLELFKEAFPSITRVALLVNANDERNMKRYVDETKAAATRLGIDFQPAEARSIGDIEQLFDKAVAAHLEGVVVAPDGMFFQGRKSLAKSALTRRLPLSVFSRETLEAGALMSYGADYRALFRRAATYVDKLLKGETPANLPVEQPTRFEFLINLKTAKALGVEISPMLLTRADEVIE
jgi:putative tryptophan/tyrosine transport system substrate-binding protein